MTIEIIKGDNNAVTDFFSSQSNTPETDAAWACFKGYIEPLQDVQDLSRKLERERDDARKELKLNKKHFCDFHRDILENCIVCQMEGAK
jgi:hypothetical protein